MKEDDLAQEISNTEFRLKELDKQEDQFNQYVAVIPESDEATIQLTLEI